MKIKGKMIGGRHKPYPYQSKIIRKMAKMPVAILGAEMGTGKTLMALMSMEASDIQSFSCSVQPLQSGTGTEKSSFVDLQVRSKLCLMTWLSS
jgi:hypothetical protein